MEQTPVVLSSTEPHCPQVILERGRLTFQEYEQQICTRRDFIRYDRKEADPEKKVRLSYDPGTLCFVSFVLLVGMWVTGSFSLSWSL